MDSDVPTVADCTDQPITLLQLRNMWQFANFCQWIYIFRKAAKIEDSIDIEIIEAECLKHDTPLLEDLAISILKLLTSHRGLTYDFQVLPLPCLYRLAAQAEQATSHDKLDDELRKQYQSRASSNAFFGNSDSPLKFSDFNVFRKIQILQKLTQWTMTYPERLRDRMDEQKDYEQKSWRIEPYGWDQEDRQYFVLDDNRVYRLTDPPPQARQKALTKARRVRKSSTRKRRHALLPPSGTVSTDLHQEHTDPRDNGLDGKKWECIAVTLQEVQQLLENMGNTRDENEKILRQQLETHLLPILEKQEKTHKRKQAQKKRELLNLAKMANPKRSSRIANKVEKQKQVEMERKEEQQNKELEAVRLRDEQNCLMMKGERDVRILARQRRFQEREERRQHVQISRDNRTQSPSTDQLSQRCLNIDFTKSKETPDKVRYKEDWVFDCVCGMHGQVDYGTHSVACERCNTWQHSQCLGIRQSEADQTDFHFLCVSCRQHDLDKHATRNHQFNDRPNSLLNTHPGHDEQAHETQSTKIVVDTNTSPDIYSFNDNSSSIASALRQSSLPSVSTTKDSTARGSDERSIYASAAT